MKAYQFLFLISFSTLTGGFPNEELHLLYERTVRTACYKAGAISGLASFAGSVIGMVLVEYLRSPREGRQPLMSPHTHKF